MGQKTRVARLYSKMRKPTGTRVMVQDVGHDGQWLETVDGEQTRWLDADLEQLEASGLNIIRIVYVENWRE